jgi:hypothetical protein
VEGRKQGLISGVGEATNKEDIRAGPGEMGRVDTREHPLREAGREDPMGEAGGVSGIDKGDRAAKGASGDGAVEAKDSTIVAGDVGGEHTGVDARTKEVSLGVRGRGDRWGRWRRSKDQRRCGMGDYICGRWRRSK